MMKDGQTWVFQSVADAPRPKVGTEGKVEIAKKLEKAFYDGQPNHKKGPPSVATSSIGVAEPPTLPQSSDEEKKRSRQEGYKAREGELRDAMDAKAKSSGPEYFKQEKKDAMRIDTVSKSRRQITCEQLAAKVQKLNKEYEEKLDKCLKKVDKVRYHAAEYNDEQLKDLDN